jgi:hypothetical protein
MPKVFVIIEGVRLNRLAVPKMRYILVAKRPILKYLYWR